MTLSFKNNKKFVMITAIVLCIAIIGGAFAIFGNFSASADGEINDINPELTLEPIDSDLESSFYSAGLYVQESKLKQSGNGAAGGTYNLNTNSYCVWVGVDDVAFAYKKYPVKNSGSDFLEAEVTIPRKAKATGRNYSSTKNSLHMNSSIGIMLRSSLEPNSAEVFLHIRGSAVLAVYRSATGNVTGVQYTNNSITFPCRLKLRREGKKVTLWYASKGGDYRKFNTPVPFTENAPLYVGLAAHSVDASTWIDADFKDFKITGLGTGDTSGGDDTSSKVTSVYTETDTPISDDTLMRETFSTDFSDRKKVTATTPSWSYKETPVIENVNGNKIWHREFLDEANYAGAKLGNWYDYEVSADVMFSENCIRDPDQAQNLFAVLARHTEIPFYGAADYALVIRNGHKLSLQKRVWKANNIDSIKNISDFDASMTLGNVFDLRTLPGNEYYGDVNEYFKSTDTKVDKTKTYYTFSKSMGYTAVAEPVAEELSTYYEAKKVKDTNNTWTCLGDGKYHNLKIRVFDNVITGYWDGVKVLEFTEDPNNIVMPSSGGSRANKTMIFTKGEIGIASFETDCYVDNILVTDIEDPLGGDYDNYIEGNWDQAVPDYLESWTEKTGDKYLN